MRTFVLRAKFIKVGSMRELSASLADRSVDSNINCRPPDKEHGLSCDPPHPIPPLPRHLVDQTTRFHPSKVALDGSPAGADQGLGHRSGHERPFGKYRAQGRGRAAGKRAHLGFRPRRPCLDIIEVTHCGQACGLHPVKPTRQTVSGWATGAQSSCPAHGQRREERPLAAVTAASIRSPCCPRPARLQRWKPMQARVTG